MTVKPTGGGTNQQVLLKPRANWNVLTSNIIKKRKEGLVRERRQDSYL